MGIEIVVDANIIISALIGGSTREILFDPRFDFLTTEFTAAEVEKYIPEMARKAGLSEGFVNETFHLIPLKIKERTSYKNSLKEAEENIGSVDKKDVEILALALETGNYLWTDDKDFDKIDYNRVIKTKDFF